jgi:hypothetical protein
VPLDHAASILKVDGKENYLFFSNFPNEKISSALWRIQSHTQPTDGGKYNFNATMADCPCYNDRYDHGIDLLIQADTVWTNRLNGPYFHQEVVFALSLRLQDTANISFDAL